jgi:hypothetical protein
MSLLTLMRLNDTVRKTAHASTTPSVTAEDRMKKLNLNPYTLKVESFPSMPEKDPEFDAILDASAESVCRFTQICTCDFTACCTV